MKGDQPMRIAVLTVLTAFAFVDRDHFTEKWTKTEKGMDTVFALNFTGRGPQP